MGFIVRVLIVAFALFALGSVAQAAPAPSSQPSVQTSTPVAGSYQEAAWWDRICCKRGYHDWFTTRRDCRRSGGYPVAAWQCRDERSDRVCCKRRGHDWWTSRRACYERGGHIVPRRECRWD